LRAGSVSAFGQEMRRWPPYRRVQAGVGYVPQGRGIFPYLSVLENILVGLGPLKGKDTGQIEEAFQLFPCSSSWRSARPACFPAVSSSSSLSHAHLSAAQSCSCSMSLRRASSPRSSVDGIQRVFAPFKGRLSVLLIEQFLDFSMAVEDQCFVMEQGRIVLQGAPAELDLDVVRRYLSV
jgi:urea transport system ATP-binding protein